MTRQVVGPKKVRKYAKATGLPVVKAMVRGNTGHRVDLGLEDGTIAEYWPRTGEVERTKYRWRE